MAELEAEQELHRAEVATYLHEFADKLAGEDVRGGGEASREGESETSSSAAVRDQRTDSAEMMRENGSEESSREETSHETAERTDNDVHEKVTFMVGNESATINPPDTVRFDMSVDSDSTMLESGARETVTFALHWDREAVDSDDELDIQ